VLLPYLDVSRPGEGDPFKVWVDSLWQAGEQIQTYALLQRLCTHIYNRLSYQLREGKYSIYPLP
jgi:5-methylcytosine-specific restriction endonuclease McrBC regulatory subunit McrC